jgi:hypothetical protein
MAEKAKSTTPSASDWKGFGPTAYHLDTEKIWGLPIRIRTREAQPADAARSPRDMAEFTEFFGALFDETGARKATTSAATAPAPEEESTVGQVITKLRVAKLVDVQRSMDVLIISLTSEEIVCHGLSFNLSLLETWLKLHKVGVNALHAQFFYYDSSGKFGKSYSFFVVCDDKIVDERITFHDGDGFAPSLLKTWDCEDRRFRDNLMQEAWERLWYRKFYTETRTGQLMVLRQDYPALYFSPEGRHFPVAQDDPGPITPPAWKVKIPGITIPFFPRVYRDRKGMTYLEWLDSNDPSLGEWSPPNPPPQLTVNSSIAAGFHFVFNLLTWLWIFTVVWIGVSLIHFMWAHALF